MMAGRTILAQILALDPERDHERIVFLMSAHEFPFDIVRADEFALFRTFAVPSISGLLDSTGEFKERAQKRYDDTVLILSEIWEHGYDSERGREALRRMNQIHGRYPISNDDYLYVLSTFVFEPIRWMERFAWRPMSAHEQQAAFHFWREVGRRMNIKAIPETREAFERFNVEYERAHFRYAATNRAVAEACRDMFLSWFLPRWARRVGAPFIYAMLDDPLLDALGFPRPSPLLRRLVQSALRMRGRLVRLLPERRRPLLRTAQRYRSYPHGYELARLGPPDPHREKLREKAEDNP